MPDITRKSFAAPAALAALALLAGAVAAPALLERGAATVAAVIAADTALDASNPLVGKPAPAFSLPDQNDKPVTLAAQKGKWVVLAFYPADMTSGCTLQNRSYTAKKDAFTGKNAVVFTVSTQGTDSKKQFCSKEGLTHTLLSDVGGGIAKAYGVLPENGKYARRWTFYIAPDGRVAGVDTKIDVATAAEESLSILDTLSKGKTGGAAAPAPAPAAGKVEMGKPVADFTLPDTASGKTASLAELSKAKKATVVVWVSTQCPVSNDYNERLAQLSEQYAARGVQFIGVNSNSREAVPEIAAHARQNDLAFPILKDADNAIADRFEAKVTPEAFVLDAKGNLVFHGAIDDSRDATKVKTKYLVSALDALVEGKPVTVQPGRAFGCTIQRVARN
ncbi:MAG TPA: redoxin domain-containing protein [Armatimonadaceae bacterium]|nr:redoxin domain-containing protein [Armatimonadaceae bacterium]